MNLSIKSLLNVLVISGAALVAHGQTTEELQIPGVEKSTVVFCSADNEEVCEAKVVNNQCSIVEKAGIECCWGTSCND